MQFPSKRNASARTGCPAGTHTSTGHATPVQGMPHQYRAWHASLGTRAGGPDSSTNALTGRNWLHFRDSWYPRV